MKKNGFTLVELLAVLVILAIITLITTISVGTTLSESKNSLSETQQKNIEEAAKAYYLKEGMATADTCVNISELIQKGYIESSVVKDPKTREEMTGSVKITYEANQYSYQYQNDACVVCKSVTDQTKTVGTVPAGNYTPGDEYTCNVDGTNEYHFFVLNTEGNNVNLIMNSDIGYSAWVTQTDYLSSGGTEEEWNYLDYGFGHTDRGPITVMNTLHDLTKTWQVSNVELNYSDSIYGGMKTVGTITTITSKSGETTATYENLKARLPFKQELSNVGCGESSCPTWLINETYVNYWTGSASTNYEIYRIYYQYGYLYYFQGTSFNYGIRPVISVPQSALK